jgi:hypothetical protein
VPIGANPTQSTATVVNVPAGGDVVAAVAQVVNAGGGTVNLAAGTYPIMAPINLGSNLTINGQGSSTVIYAPPTPGAFGMIQAANGGVSNIIIENLVLDGNIPLSAFGQGAEYGVSGIYLLGSNNGVNDILVKNVEIRNANIGILMTVTNSITFNNIYVHDNNPGNFSHNAYLVGCDFVYITHSRFMHAHTGDGLHIDFDAAYYLISKSEFSNNHGEGVLDQGATQINIQDSQFNWNVNDGLNASSTGELLTRSIANYNGGDGYNIQGGEDSTDLVDIPHMGYDFFNYGAGAFSNLVGGTTPNQYLAILGNGVTGATDTADWVTSLSGYQGGGLSGYSSIGVVDFNVNHLANGLLTFPAVGVVGAGPYSTTWAYSNGSGATVSMALTINGVSAGTISFPSTGSWSTWSTVNVNMTLHDGGNVVSVSPQGTAAPLLDYMQVNTAVPSPPAVPTGVAVSALSPYSTQITWNAVPGASSYLIIRSGATLAVGVSGTSYTDSDILLGSSTYAYQVVASNQGGNSAASAAVTITTPIDAPAGLTNGTVSGYNTLSWLSSNGAVSYILLRSYASGGPYTPIASISQTSYTDLTATPDVDAYYVVEAVNAAGTASGGSYELRVPTPASFGLTLAGSTLTLEPGNSGTLGITVNASSGFSGTVSFTASSLPSGATSSFNPSSSTTGTTLQVSVPAAIAPGTVPITVTGTSGSITRSIVFNLIVPAPQTITFNGISSQAAGSTLALTATASSGLPVTYTSSTPSVCTVTGATATLLSAGNCTLIAAQSGNATNNPATSVTQSFSVLVEGFTLGIAAPMLTVAPGTSGSDAITVTRTNGFSGAITYAVAGLPTGVTGSIVGNSLNVVVSSGAAPGSTPLTITGTSGSVVATTSVTLVVPAPQTITFNAISSQAAGSSLTLTGTASSGLPVTYTSSTPSVCTVTGATATLLSAGTCTLIASQSGNATNNPATSVTQSFSVLVEGFTLSTAAPALTVLEGTTGSDAVTVTRMNGFSGAITYTVVGLPTGVTGAISGNALNVVVSSTAAPGSTPLTITGTSGSVVATASVTLVVASTAPQTQTLTFNTIATQTAATSLTLTATASSGLPVSFASTTPAVCTVAGTTAKLLTDGTCTLVASQAGSGSYRAATSVTQSFNVVSPSFTLQAQSTTLSIDANAAATDLITVTPIDGFTGAIGYSVTGLPIGVTSSFSGNSLQLTVSASTAAGSYPVLITGTSGAQRAQVDVTLTVVDPGTSVGTTTVESSSSGKHGGGAVDLWSLGGLLAVATMAVRRRLLVIEPAA